jgi:hypothetical protein
MIKPNIWFFYRVVSLGLGLFSFSQAIHLQTNFGVMAGLICGSVILLFVIFVVNKNSVTQEKMFIPTSPCWPAAKYPQAYWFSTGVVIFLSAFGNYIFHTDNSSAEDLYIGLLLLGLGMCAGAVIAYYQVKRRGD